MLSKMGLMKNWGPVLAGPTAAVMSYQLSSYVAVLCYLAVYRCVSM